MPGHPFDTDRAVSLLLRKYGCCSLGVALERAELCARRDDRKAAREWRTVAVSLRALLTAKPEGPLH